MSDRRTVRREVGSSASSGVHGTGSSSGELTAPAATATAAGAPSEAELLQMLLNATDRAIAARTGRRPSRGQKGLA